MLTLALVPFAFVGLLLVVIGIILLVVGAGYMIKGVFHILTVSTWCWMFPTTNWAGHPLKSLSREDTDFFGNPL